MPNPYYLRPIGITHCLKCGKKLTYKQQSLRQKYCSRACAGWPLITERCVCQYCQKEFKPNQRENMKYCSRRCSDEDPNRKRGRWANPDNKFKGQVRKVWFKKCLMCDDLFTIKVANTKVCKQCQGEWKREQQRQQQRKKYNWKLVTKVCDACDKVFQTYRTKQIYCSEGCQIRWEKRYYNAIRGHKETSGEKVSLRKVFDKDGGRCQLMCGRKLRLENKVPHPQAPVRDHIIPLSKGGAHEYKNIQLACFICNSRKGAGVVRGGEQLRLL